MAKRHWDSKGRPWKAMDDLEALRAWNRKLFHTIDKPGLDRLGQMLSHQIPEEPLDFNRNKLGFHE